MIQLTPQMRIFLAVEPVDFRKGIDGMSAVCRQKLDRDPFSGALFLFRNKKATAVKILIYDGQGFWLCQKRLSKGKFSWWPAQEGPAVALSSAKLQILLWNGNPLKARIPADWRKVRQAAAESGGPCAAAKVSR